MKCPVIYDAERYIWSNPFKVLPPKMCLGQRILQKLDQNDPNKIIEVNYDNGEKLTSSQLKTLVITAAQNLLNLGIKKGDIILFFNQFNSLTTPIVFACFIIGAAICPLELALEDDDADYIISKLDPTIILYDQILKTRVESTVERITLLNLKFIFSFESGNDGQSVPEMLFKTIQSKNVFVGPDLGDPDLVIAALLLTSGTTGRPKLTSLSHSQMSFDINTYWKTDSNSIICVPTPFRWVVPVVFLLFPIFGDCCRVFSGQILTPELCLKLIKKYEVTHFGAVDGLLNKIFQCAEIQQCGNFLKTLQYVLTGGERISKHTYNLVRKLTPNSTFLRCYGMTEFAGLIASTAYESITNNFECGNGYIAQGFSLKIIDDNQKSLGPNENGQICIKRIAPHLLYYNNDKANAEAFINDGEWFLTGDYGKFDNDNFLYVFNRCKYLIRYGQNILIPSISETYLEDLNILQFSYIVGIPDSDKGEIPVAFIKLNTNASNDWKSHEELRAYIKKFLKSVLPKDQLPPEKIYFVENFPYTCCGKIDRMALKKLAK